MYLLVKNMTPFSVKCNLLLRKSSSLFDPIFKFLKVSSNWKLKEYFCEKWRMKMALILEKNNRFALLHHQNFVFSSKMWLRPFVFSSSKMILILISQIIQLTSPPILEAVSLHTVVVLWSINNLKVKNQSGIS